MDEETLLCSPFQEIETEAGTATACAAQAISCTARGSKCKQDSGPTPKNAKGVHLSPLGGTFKQAKEDSLLDLVLYVHLRATLYNTYSHTN